MNRRLFRLNSNGDTIIEVLIVLAILSTALTLSYAIANKGLGQSRNAAEHSEALNILTSQVEYLRTAVSKQSNVFLNRPFCMNASSPDATFPPAYTIPSTTQADTLASYPAACKSGTFYNSSVEYRQNLANPEQSYFIIRVRWDGANGTSGRQEESIQYRIHQLTADSSAGIPIAPAGALIQVRAKKIAPNADNTTPNCSNSADLDKAGSAVNLSIQGAGAPYDSTQTTNSSSSVTYSNLNDYSTYRATISAAPAGYEICPPPPPALTTKQAVPGTTQVIDFKIRPVCYVNTVRDFLGNYGDFQGNYGDYLGNYPDFLGNYGDPYLVLWWAHEGPDGRHPEWNSTRSPFSTQPNDFTQTEGADTVNYRRLGSLYYATGPFYERWVLRGGTAYTAAYDHYSAAYDHYSTPPYDHYSPYYTVNVCPS